MAIDSQQPALAAATPAIDNEVPAYRAVSPMAVTSLILGLLAILSFVDMTFLLAGAGAIVTGVLATRKIQRVPEVLTGRTLAQVGAALGVIFSLASVTTSGMQFYFRKTEATDFARRYAEVLKKESLSQCLWYKLRPDERATIPIAEAADHFQKRMADPMVFEQFSGSLKDLKARIESSPNQQVRFVEIEDHGVRGLNSFAQALVKVEGPATEQFPNKEEYALLSLAGVSKNGGIDWMVEQVVYPYTPGSKENLVEAVDDGHGHGGGGHAH